MTEVKTNKAKHWAVLAISAALLIALFTPVLVLWKVQSWGNTPQQLTTPQDVKFPERTTLQELAKELENSQLIDSATFFHILVRAKYDFQKFQAGDYRFAGTITPAQVAEKIINGDVYAELKLTVTIPEGFTTSKIIARLAEYGIDNKQKLQTLITDQNFINSLGISNNVKSLEGYLYPATYKFYHKKPSGREIFTQMVRKLQEVIPKDYEQKLNELEFEKKLSLHEALTFASLIELETMHNDERIIISEVIWRRLQDNTPLGIDAALIYGIKDYAGDLTHKHLKDATNPYNTRMHRGLPPSPIGSPSLASIMAVITPADTESYFYVLIPDGNGRHHFSKTLQEHNLHVEKLVQATKQKKN